MHPSQYSTDDVCDWLQHTDFAELEPMFREQGVDGRTLLRLTTDNIHELGKMVRLMLGCFVETDCGHF